MTFVLLLITLAVVVYLAGTIRALQQRVDLLEHRVARNSVPSRQEEPEAEFSNPEPTAPTSAPSSLEPILIARANRVPISPQPTIEPPILAPVAAQTESFTPEPHIAPTIPPPIPDRVRKPEFNLEQFLGAKMLAWLGGLALFVGIAFFVKYSFDRDLIPPWLRVVAGFAIGAGLVVAGMRIRKKDYLITAQTLVATGVVILYCVSFISRSFYHLINTPTLFILMTGITVAAFTLAIRMDARVVAVLGMLGGFLTPLFVGVPREYPLPLLGYVLVLNCGLLTVARRQNWRFLIPLAAIATALTEMFWVVTSLRGHNLIATLLMMAAITILFVVNARFNPDPTEDQPRSLFAGVLQSFVILATFWFMQYRHGAQLSPTLLLSTLFFGNAALIALYAISLHVLPLIAAVSACGGLLALWISKTQSTLGACIAVVIYAALNALLPTWIAKLRDGSKYWPNVASVAGLGLMLLVLFGNSNPGWIFWFAVLLLNLVLLAIAIVRRNLVLALCGTIATAVLSVNWIVRLENNHSLTEPLLIIGAFALLYFFTARPLTKQNADDPNALYFPAIPAAIPFLLLALLITRLDLQNPSLIFAFALGLNLLLIFATPRAASVFPLVALIGTLLLEGLWFVQAMSVSKTITSLVWFTAFSLFFTFFPLLSRRSQSIDWLPWYASALAGPIHFVLIYSTARFIWPQLTLPGLIPAVLGIPALIMFSLTRKSADPLQSQRFMGIYGASLLFFITFIFPIQFDRQWLTLGWALEGAALIWLNRRAPAKWIVVLGSVLLTIAFARLAANPLIFRYYERSGIPLLNWYLYSYGIVAAALFAAARWAPKEEPTARIKGAFIAMATLLLFFLVNIQIADLFSDGRYLAFDFTGNFARNMTYSIAWSLFALALLIIGVRRDTPVVRYAGLALMGLTLLKLFLHDLTQLDALFRIGAFVGVAVILIFASWLYQRFLSTTRKLDRTQSSEPT